MTKCEATIVKAFTEDGHFHLHPNAPYKLGQTVEVDLSSRKVEPFEQRTTGQKYTTEVVNEIDPQNPQGPPMFFPTEMLEFRCVHCGLGLLIVDGRDLRCDTCLEINE